MCRGNRHEDVSRLFEKSQMAMPQHHASQCLILDTASPLRRYDSLRLVEMLAATPLTDRRARHCS